MIPRRKYLAFMSEGRGLKHFHTPTNWFSLMQIHQYYNLVQCKLDYVVTKIVICHTFSYMFFILYILVNVHMPLKLPF
jgi:hypothetical protein